MFRMFNLPYGLPYGSPSGYSFPEASLKPFLGDNPEALGTDLPPILIPLVKLVPQAPPLVQAVGN